MRIFVTGATGFIGSALTRRLLGEGHEVRAWVRSEARARQLLGAAAALVAPQNDAALRDALAGCDAVIDLAGENVMGHRWTDAYKQTLIDSRVGVTDRLVRAMAEAPAGPRALVSASAVGYYGDAGDAPLDESSPAGSGFLADLCQQWEAAAQRATAHGIRVTVVRIGIVLGRGGGALAKMVTPFRAFVGGPIGSGRQFVPWIHLDDLVSLIVVASRDERYVGVVNGVGPAPVRNSELARALGRALGRPSSFPTPAALLKLVLGQSAEAVLAGQNAHPARAQDLGFEFKHADLDLALGSLLSATPGR